MFGVQLVTGAGTDFNTGCSGIQQIVHPFPGRHFPLGVEFFQPLGTAAFVYFFQPTVQLADGEFQGIGIFLGFEVNLAGGHSG